MEQNSSTKVVLVIGAILFGGIIVFGAVAALIVNLTKNVTGTRMQPSRQKRTMADVRTVGVAILSYQTDHDGYPKVPSYDALGPLLVPTYIRVLPLADGWGHVYRYACTEERDGRCVGFVLGSAGRDGVFTQQDLRVYAASPPGPTTNFDCDVIFSNGRFIEYPEGIQR